MKKNDDQFVIVMDRDIYHELLGLASIGASEVGDHDTFQRVERHVRKFNTPVKWQVLKHLEQAIKIAKANRANAISLINSAPKDLFRRVGRDRIQRVQFVGRDWKHKQYVRVRALTAPFQGVRPKEWSEHINSLLTEVPESWMEIVYGTEMGLFMPIAPNPGLEADFAAADAALGLSHPNS
ncbi:hypothetical protein D3C71_77480 [compost metagenome]